MSFQKKALRALLADNTELADVVLCRLIDSLPEELDYADMSSKDVADQLLESLVQEAP